MNNKPLKYVPFAIIISLVIIYVSRSMSNHILLFPFWLNAVLFFIGFPIAWYYVSKWKIFSNDKVENKKIILAVNTLLAVIVTFVILCFLRLPLNMLIKQQSKKNERITQTCPITFYSLGLKNQNKKHITFTFNEKNIRMKVPRTMMAKIKALQTPQKNIQLQVRKSILGTYVVEDYDVN
jgi:hypothetical protein